VVCSTSSDCHHFRLICHQCFAKEHRPSGEASHQGWCFASPRLEEMARLAVVEPCEDEAERHGETMGDSETVSDTQKLDGWNMLKYVETTLQLWPEYTKPGSKHIQTIQVKRTKFIPNLRVSELQLDRLKSPVDSCKWLYRMPYPVHLFKRI